ncbi:UNVERIFIED_CONTAM: hypothetical protein K2H54_057731 [Gekko kuhli]
MNETTDMFGKCGQSTVALIQWKGVPSIEVNGECPCACRTLHVQGCVLKRMQCSFLHWFNLRNLTQDFTVRLYKSGNVMYNAFLDRAIPSKATDFNGFKGCHSV